MARYTGPKFRQARREGVNIIGRVSRALDRRLSVPPGVHGRRGRRKTSEFGEQLREKQKLKRIYGLLERQFRKYVKIAQKKKGNTEEALIQFLETRLDNIVYRLGFAKSRAQARQMVVHGHILVNNKKVTIPSYNMRENDVISLSSKIVKTPDVKELIETKEDILSFLEKKKAVGRLLRLPSKDEVANPVDYQLVIEYYSR